MESYADESYPSGILPQGRIGPDGIITFPHRGKPPRTILGYEPDPGDPFVQKPILKMCKHRVEKWKMVCGGMIKKMDCSRFKIAISAKDCFVCTDAEE